MFKNTRSRNLDSEISLESVDLLKLKEFLEFSEKDVTEIIKLHAKFNENISVFINEFYNHLSQFPELESLLGNTENLNRLKQFQHEYFTQISMGNYDLGYANNRLKIGVVHEEAGLPIQFYIGAYQQYLTKFITVIYDFCDTKEKFNIALRALLKIIFLDMGLVTQAYIKAAQSRIANQKEHLEKIVSNMPSGLMVLDKEMNIISLNPALVKMLNLSSSELYLGHPVSKLFGSLIPEIQNILDCESSQPVLALTWKTSLSAKDYVINVTRSTVNEEQNLMVFFSHDFNEFNEIKERALWLAQFDVLTGLPNRKFIIEQIALKIELANRNSSSVAVLLLDIDHFKKINETLGHDIGDEILVEISKRIKFLFPSEDVVARFGGDEFILLIAGPKLSDIADISGKIISAISQSIHTAKHEIIVTPSIGIAMFPDDGDNPESLIRHADIAMYQAKSNGRNNYCFYKQEMQLQVDRTLLLENAMRHALARDQFSLNYQPQVFIDDQRVIGAEALLRWTHPTLGNISPEEFIPIAETTGHIEQIGEWVIRSAAKQWKAWMDKGLVKGAVAVNLSSVQFRNPNLPSLISEILGEINFPPEHIELELTEGCALKDPDAAILIMQDLFDRGISLAIDDFGTGYSSLSYLKQFRIKRLKIDQSFIRSATKNSKDEAIIVAIINIANSLSLETICEGVETSEQLSLIRSHGCTEAQGYYFSRPLVASEFEMLLTIKNGHCTK